MNRYNIYYPNLRLELPKPDARTVKGHTYGYSLRCELCDYVKVIQHTGPKSPKVQYCPNDHTRLMPSLK